MRRQVRVASAQSFAPDCILLPHDLFTAGKACHTFGIGLGESGDSIRNFAFA
jgi:hypothetical protein